MMTKKLIERILEALPPYPVNNNNKDREAGYHEALDNFIQILDNLLIETRNKDYRCSYCIENGNISCTECEDGVEGALE